MKWWAATVLGVAVVGAFITWRAFSQSVTHKPDVAATSELRERGEYLVRAGDCVGCHTAAGRYPFSGGREFDLGRLGKLYSPNITPDKETGIGNWSDDDFRAAMQLGVGRDGEHLYPAFPYASYTLLSDDDVLAIKAYLFTVSPVRSVPPENELRFPFNQRFLMAFWSLLFNPNQRFVTDAGHTAAWNRGKYLVEGLGHCGECHTPRNLLQARSRGSAYAGAVADHWLAFNISSDRDSGIGGWSDAALRSYLTEGFAAGHGPASGPMAEVVSNSLRHLTHDDMGAIIEYLRTIKPVRAPLTAGAPVASPAAASLAHGKQVYEGVCANCHHIDGAGNQTRYEALNGSRSLRDPHANNLIQAVLYGSSMETPLGQVSMPGFARVIETVAREAGWGRSLPKGQGLGIAATYSFVSYAAVVTHVAVDAQGQLEIPRMDIAIDCGAAINPDRVRSQSEGACIMGVSLAKSGEITFKDGRVVQSNFHDYTVLRMNEAPREIRVHLLPSDFGLPLGGVGEPGTPPVAPALCNAIFAATGIRIRQLPIRDQLLRTSG